MGLGGVSVYGSVSVVVDVVTWRQTANCVLALDRVYNVLRLCRNSVCVFGNRCVSSEALLVSSP